MGAPHSELGVLVTDERANRTEETESVLMISGARSSDPVVPVATRWGLVEGAMAARWDHPHQRESPGWVTAVSVLSGQGAHTFQVTSPVHGRQGHEATAATWASNRGR